MKNIGETILNLIDKKLILSCHDVSLGGILTAVSKMCIKGNKGIKINNNPIEDDKFLISSEKFIFEVIDVQKKLGDLFIHYGKVIKGSIKLKENVPIYEII